MNNNNTITTSQTLKYATYHIETLFTEDDKWIMTFINAEVHNNE